MCVWLVFHQSWMHGWIHEPPTLKSYVQEDHNSTNYQTKRYDWIKSRPRCNNNLAKTANAYCRRCKGQGCWEEIACSAKIEPLAARHKEWHTERRGMVSRKRPRCRYMFNVYLPRRESWRRTSNTWCRNSSFRAPWWRFGDHRIKIRAETQRLKAVNPRTHSRKHNPPHTQLTGKCFQ